MKCKNRDCRVEMGLGHYIFRLDNPRKQGRTIPPDVIIPQVDVRDDHVNGAPVCEVVLQSETDDD